MVQKQRAKAKKKYKQKQTQSQKQNVNQIVRIYLDERKKSRQKKTAPQKNLKGGNIPNINISPIFQNPLNDMYSLQQPYNPFFYPRPPPPVRNQLQPPAIATPSQLREPVPIVNPTPPQRVIPPAPPSSPVARPQPIIPPGIDVPTNPLVAPPRPINNFPNLQNVNADPVPRIGSPLQVKLPFYTQDPAEDKLAMDFNMGLGRSSAIQERPAQLELLGEEFHTDEEKNIVRHYNALRGDTRGRRPQTIEGYKRAIDKLLKQNRPDPVTTPPKRGQAEEVETPPFKTGIGHRERVPIGRARRTGEKIRLQQRD